MNSLQQRILKVPVPDIEGAYLLVSFPRRSEYEAEVKVQTMLTLFLDMGDRGVEWEPEHGPLHFWLKCEADHPAAAEHYFYNYVSNKGEWDWSQSATDKLVAPLWRGEFKYVFGAMRYWGECR